MALDHILHGGMPCRSFDQVPDAAKERLAAERERRRAAQEAQQVQRVRHDILAGVAEMVEGRLAEDEHVGSVER
jgi:hypothetical protein